MKTLIIIAFASFTMSILAWKLFSNLPGRFIIEVLGIVALSGFFIIIGYRCIWTWSLARVIPAIQSRKWPSVEGKIIYSSIREESAGRGGPPGTHIYYPQIKYVYDVNGERFEGQNLLYEQEGPPVLQRQIVAKDLESLAVGQTVKVFYDFQSPSRSCLKPGFYENPMAHVLMNLLGVFLLTSSVVGLWRGARLLNKDRSQRWVG